MERADTIIIVIIIVIIVIIVIAIVIVIIMIMIVVALATEVTAHPWSARTSRFSKGGCSGNRV